MATPTGDGISVITLEILVDGIKQVNQTYIEQPEFDGNYPAMVVQYLISSFLIAQGGKAEDFGFYLDSDSVGYTGWLAIGEQVLFFAPAKVIILDRDNLSPYGELS